MVREGDRDQRHEGPEAAKRFEDTLTHIVSVPKEELARREAEYKKARPKARTRAHPAR